MELRTERLLLRRARSDDVEAMHTIVSDPRAMRYWSTLPHADLAVTRDWFAHMLGEQPPDRDQFIIEHDGRLIGRVGIWRMPELGFILHPDMWGRGFASEALGAFIGHVFATHAMDGLTADVDPRNAASLKVLAKAGFVEIGRAQRTFLLGDEWCDSIYLALRRPLA